MKKKSLLNDNYLTYFGGWAVGEGGGGAGKVLLHCYVFIRFIHFHSQEIRCHITTVHPSQPPTSITTRLHPGTVLLTSSPDGGSLTVTMPT